MELEGKVALITGGAQGIGAETARLFAREGAAVAVADLNAEKLAALEAEITDAGGRMKGIVADCGEVSGIERAVSETAAAFGGLDILLAAAIFRPTKPFMEVTEADLDLALAVNVKGYFLTVQRAVPEFRKRGKGNVILMSSTYGFAAAPDFSVYCACKGAVVNMVRSLGLELAPENIRVNGVAPGPIMTEGMKELIEENPYIVEHRTANMPMPRFGEPEEVAQTILFLASDRSSYVHGHHLVVDGGYLSV